MQFQERRNHDRLISKDVVVLYHGKCSDGFGAAWAAWKKWGDQAEYLAVEDHNVPPPGLTGKEIYMVDFTYNRPALDQLLKDNVRVTAIDHHESVRAEIESTRDFLYSPAHSGAVLTWQYFHPNTPTPALLSMIEDMDLWRFALPYTREFFAYLDQFEMDFQIWDRLAADFADPVLRDAMRKEGERILVYQDKLMKAIAASAVRVVFEGYTVYAVNSPLFRSELGNYLATRHPPLAIVWRQDGDLILVSLRSDGTVDVGALAQRYGGGGHPTSAGFTVHRFSDIPWKIVT